MNTVARSWLQGTAVALALTLGACTGSNTETSDTAPDSSGAPVVVLKTSSGVIEIELFEEKSPESVKNFLQYVDDGFYDGTLFHRVIPDFMVQGGGYNGDRTRKETRPPIKNEADNGLKNENGTVAMARTSAPDSATAQFFINVKDNSFLDHTAPTREGYGYAVFGRIITGMDVIETIENSPTKSAGGAFANLPETEVLIESATRK
jgi:cyclophilin family peptidyl-prolyl cis-trans isomerase